MKRCNWCGTTILDLEMWEVVDTMLLHSSNNNQIRVNSCVAAYREYCRYIKAQGDIEVRASI